MTTAATRLASECRLARPRAARQDVRDGLRSSHEQSGLGELVRLSAPTGEARRSLPDPPILAQAGRKLIAMASKPALHDDGVELSGVGLALGSGHLQPPLVLALPFLRRHQPGPLAEEEPHQFVDARPASDSAPRLLRQGRTSRSSMPGSSPTSTAEAPADFVYSRWALHHPPLLLEGVGAAPDANRPSSGGVLRLSYIAYSLDTG